MDILFRSWDMSTYTLAEGMLRMWVNHTDFIDWYQNKYNTEEEYRVISITKMGRFTINKSTSPSFCRFSSIF
ncbi:hypothetical protein ACTWP4_06000 [Gracilibacillus sp. D59]|uniref:hypothetical protein n=1 Tax=Gracilibacillus sp. D59 TaxID=3457434 RepID=UPI003FCD3AE5